MSARCWRSRSSRLASRRDAWFTPANGRPGGHFPAARPSRVWGGVGLDSVVGTEAEEFDGVVDGGEARLGGHLLRPLLDDAALDLDAAAADPARQVVVMAGGSALPVQGLARRVTDRIDRALLAEHLQVPVHGGEAYGLTLPAKLGVDLLGAAEAGEAGQSRGDRRRLPGPAHPCAARLLHCHISQGSRPFVR